MKKLLSLLSICILFCLCIAASAQEFETANPEKVNPNDYPRANRLALGFELTEFQKDFGLGLNLTTPYFFNHTTAIRLHTGIAWREGVDNDDEYTPIEHWNRYLPMRLAFVFSLGLGNGLSRVYGEAGGLLYLDAGSVSSNTVVGGYGEFGFELFPSMRSPVSYFIQAGGMGSSGKGTELLGQPSFANGFMIEVGIRWYPKKKK